MHSSSRYDVQVTQADNSPSYSYVKQLNHRLKSPEYQASLNYERVFGSGGEGGKFLWDTIIMAVLIWKRKKFAIRTLIL